MWQSNWNAKMFKEAFPTPKSKHEVGLDKAVGLSKKYSNSFIMKIYFQKTITSKRLQIAHYQQTNELMPPWRKYKNICFTKQIVKHKKNRHTGCLGLHKWHPKIKKIVESAHYQLWENKRHKIIENEKRFQIIRVKSLVIRFNSTHFFFFGMSDFLMVVFAFPGVFVAFKTFL